MKKIALALLAIYAVGGLVACGGGGSGAGNGASSAPAPLTPAQVAALTATDIAGYTDTQIAGLGTNIQFLSNAALSALTYYTGTTPGHTVGQIETISPQQIAVLSAAQIRFIGAAGAGGATLTSLIRWLNVSTWATLVNDPLQVAAITAAEAATLTDGEITGFGLNIKFLSNAALGLLSSFTGPTNPVGQVESISAAQIAVLTPAQVRLIGSTGIGGATTTSQIAGLNVGAWAALVADPLQVAAMTAAEVASLYGNNFEKTVSLGTSIQYLTPAAIAGIGTSTAYTFSGLQITFLSAAQIAVMSPAQISALAGGTLYVGITTYLTASISQLNAGAFSALGAAQIAVLTPANMALVTPAQLASLSLTAIAGFTPTTKASLTPAQVASLSAAQHTACGC